MKPSSIQKYSRIETSEKNAIDDEQNSSLSSSPLLLFFGGVLAALVTVLIHDYMNVAGELTSGPLSSPSMIIGIFATKHEQEKRNWIRQTWMLQNDDFPKVEIYFVIARTQDSAILKEQEKYGDILMLDIVENLHRGKTYAWFCFCAKHFYDMNYVIKTELSTFIRLKQLQSTLDKSPRQNFYFGMYSREETDNWHNWNYIDGQLVVLTQDLIQWIATSNIPRTLHIGNEDRVTGGWFYLANKYVIHGYLYENDQCKPWTADVKKRKTFFELYEKMDEPCFNTDRTSKFLGTKESASKMPLCSEPGQRTFCK